MFLNKLFYTCVVREPAYCPLAGLPELKMSPFQTQTLPITRNTKGAMCHCDLARRPRRRLRHSRRADTAATAKRDRGSTAGCAGRGLGPRLPIPTDMRGRAPFRDDPAPSVEAKLRGLAVSSMPWRLTGRFLLIRTGCASTLKM